jgi:hypothetical protein
MDPNVQNPQGESDTVNKLEQDLKDISQQTATTPQPPVIEQPLQPVPQVPEVPSAVPSSQTPVAPATPLDTSSFVPESSKKSSPILIIAIILAIVALLAVVAYVFGAKLLSPKPTPTPVAVVTPSPISDVTANWNAYINTKVGFQLKYPNRYQKPALPSGVAGSPIIYATGQDDSTDIIFGQSSLDSFDLVVFPFTGTADQLKNYQSPPIILSSDSSLSLIKNIQVGTVTGNWYQSSSSSGFIRVYFVENNHGFIFNTLANHNVGEVNQILSTFKFIEATPAASPTASPIASPTSSPSATPLNDGSG